MTYKVYIGVDNLGRFMHVMDDGDDSVTDTKYITQAELFSSVEAYENFIHENDIKGYRPVKATITLESIL